MKCRTGSDSKQHLAVLLSLNDLFVHKLLTVLEANLATNVFQDGSVLLYLLLPKINKTGVLIPFNSSVVNSPSRYRSKRMRVIGKTFFLSLQHGSYFSSNSLLLLEFAVALIPGSDVKIHHNTNTLPLVLQADNPAPTNKHAGMKHAHL
jgi:hypothetical protein